MRTLVLIVFLALPIIGVALAADRTPTPSPTPTATPKICAIIRCRATTETPQPIQLAGGPMATVENKNNSQAVAELNAQLLIDLSNRDPVPSVRITSIDIKFRKIMESRARYGTLHGYVDIGFANGNHMTMSYYPIDSPILPSGDHDVGCMFNVEPVDYLTSLSFAVSPEPYYNDSSSYAYSAKRLSRWRVAGFIPSPADRARRTISADLIELCEEFARGTGEFPKSHNYDRFRDAVQKGGADNVQLALMLVWVHQVRDANRIATVLGFQLPY